MALYTKYNYINVNNAHFQFKVTDDKIYFYKLGEKKRQIVRDEEIFGRKKVYRFKEHFFSTHIAKIIAAKVAGEKIPSWQELYQLQFREIVE